MIILHDTFVCKPGNASKLASLMKEMADVSKKYDMKVMTDMTGQYHRVIMSSTYENLAEYETESKKMDESPEMKAMMDKFANMNEMYTSGSREIFKVW